jgi:D-hexose-6-phosphate mutarotase
MNTDWKDSRKGILLGSYEKMNSQFLVDYAVAMHSWFKVAQKNEIEVKQLTKMLSVKVGRSF